MPLAPLPDLASELIASQEAPSRLVRHLELVHDCARTLLSEVQKLGAQAPCNDRHVLLGASLHDIGKVKHLEELTGPGKQHEAAGHKLLLAEGIEPLVARFCLTHGYDPDNSRLDFEDLIVMLADKIWKGRRLETLEKRVLKLANCAGDRWEVFLSFDETLEAMAADADKRLSYQG